MLLVVKYIIAIIIIILFYYENVHSSGHNIFFFFLLPLALPIHVCDTLGMCASKYFSIVQQGTEYFAITLSLAI